MPVSPPVRGARAPGVSTPPGARRVRRRDRQPWAIEGGRGVLPAALRSMVSALRQPAHLIPEAHWRTLWSHPDPELARAVLCAHGDLVRRRPMAEQVGLLVRALDGAEALGAWWTPLLDAVVVHLFPSGGGDLPAKWAPRVAGHILPHDRLRALRRWARTAPQEQLTPLLIGAQWRPLRRVLLGSVSTPTAAWLRAGPWHGDDLLQLARRPRLAPDLREAIGACALDALSTSTESTDWAVGVLRAVGAGAGLPPTLRTSLLALVPTLTRRAEAIALWDLLSGDPGLTIVERHAGLPVVRATGTVRCLARWTARMDATTWADVQAALDRPTRTRLWDAWLSDKTTPSALLADLVGRTQYASDQTRWVHIVHHPSANDQVWHAFLGVPHQTALALATILRVRGARRSPTVRAAVAAGAAPVTAGDLARCAREPGVPDAWGDLFGQLAARDPERALALWRDLRRPPPDTRISDAVLLGLCTAPTSAIRALGAELAAYARLSGAVSAVSAPPHVRIP